MRLVALLFKTSYQLRHHEWAGVLLDRWMTFLLLILAGLFAIGVLPGRLAGVVTCSVLVLAQVVTAHLASRRQFVVFTSEASTTHQRHSAPIVEPINKLTVRATGLFEVEGKEQYFSDLQATYSSFKTREHAVMAIVPPSRTLLVGSWPDENIGMWYIFFKNEEIRCIEPGQLSFGRQTRPAIQIDVAQVIPPPTSPVDVWGGYRSGKQKLRIRQHTIYLSFDSPFDLQTALADLLVDGPGANATG